MSRDYYNITNRGPLHDRCSKCYRFAIMVDHYEKYICIECYLRELEDISINKDRKEVDSLSLFSLSSEPLKELIRQQAIEIWD